MSTNQTVLGHPAFPPAANPNFPPAQTYDYYQHNQPYTYRRNSFIRRFVGGFISVIVIIGVLLLIVWLVQHPREPEFRVDSLTTTNFNVSDSLVSGSWKVGLSVSNPNKKLSISYDEIHAGLYYVSEFLSSTSLAPFYQGTRSSSAINASFAASSAYVDGGKSREMMDERARGSVRFTLLATTRVRFRNGGWRLRPRNLRVWCGGLDVGFSSKGGDGKLSGRSRDCEIGL